MKSRECKYCARPRQKFKSCYGKTCGASSCRSEAMRRAAGKRTFGIKSCKHCGSEFTRKSARQKWCKTCVPNHVARQRMQRYGVSAPRYAELKEENNGICQLCNKRAASDIDHNHLTKEVRGLLCKRCNSTLSNVEDTGWLERALQYAVRKQSASRVLQHP